MGLSWSWVGVKTADETEERYLSIYNNCIIEDIPVPKQVEEYLEQIRPARNYGDGDYLNAIEGVRNMVVVGIPKDAQMDVPGARGAIIDLKELDPAIKYILIVED